MFLPENKKPKISFEQQMASTLRINENIKLDCEGESFIQLIVGLKLNWFAKLVNILYKVRDYRKIRLLGFHCTIYRKIKEGPILMRDMVRWFQDLEKLSFFEARNLLMNYTGSMMQRGLIVIEVPKLEEDEDGNPVIVSPDESRK